MPIRSEFRASTDQMLAILEEVRSIEEAKRATSLGSPEFVELARTAAEHARLAFRWAQLELQLAEHAAARVASGETPRDVRLVDVTPRPLDVVLASWREAQIRLEIAEPGSEAARLATDDIERLREEYHTGLDDRTEAAEALGRLPGNP